VALLVKISYIIVVLVLKEKKTKAQTEPKRGFAGYIVVYHIHQQRQKGMLDQLQLLQQPLPLK
jgi:transcriptional regulator CtsR